MVEKFEGINLESTVVITLATGLTPTGLIASSIHNLPCRHG